MAAAKTLVCQTMGVHIKICSLPTIRWQAHLGATPAGQLKAMFAMNADAIDQAKSRLSRAEKALAALSAAKAIEEAEAAWTDFLIAAATIYSKLEQGAKGSGRCEGWFGQKKKARKDDQLLRYLHFARNSNEHGIERVVATSAAIS
jgi:hypothetical protein